jgi:hypothetical protein
LTIRAHEFLSLVDGRLYVFRGSPARQTFGCFGGLKRGTQYKAIHRAVLTASGL